MEGDEHTHTHTWQNENCAADRAENSSTPSSFRLWQRSVIISTRTDMDQFGFSWIESFSFVKWIEIKSLWSCWTTKKRKNVAVVHTKLYVEFGIAGHNLRKEFGTNVQSIVESNVQFEWFIIEQWPVKCLWWTILSNESSIQFRFWFTVRCRIVVVAILIAQVHKSRGETTIFVHRIDCDGHQQCTESTTHTQWNL